MNDFDEFRIKEYEGLFTDIYAVQGKHGLAG